MMSANSLYAAYGPNMDPELMLDRCPRSPLAGTGWVNGWRLTFCRGASSGNSAAMATIVPHPDASVFVALYDLAPLDRVELDRWERADTGLTNTIRVRVSTLEGDVVAFLYVADEYEGGLPTARYLGLLAESAERAGAPDVYLSELRSRPCL
jgi:hypothetical protein